MIDPVTNLPECSCTCASGWSGRACETSLTTVLVLSPKVAIFASVAAVVAVGAMMSSCAAEPQIEWSNNIIILEILDSVLDILTFGLTWLTGGFEYANDPSYLLAKFVACVAIGTMFLFAFEVVILRLHKGEHEQRSELAKYFLVIHILAEDGLQLVVYTVASASQTTDFAIGIGVGILQGIIFFIAKTNELFKVGSRYRDISDPDVTA